MSTLTQIDARHTPGDSLDWRARRPLPWSVAYYPAHVGCDVPSIISHDVAAREGEDDQCRAASGFVSVYNAPGVAEFIVRACNAHDELVAALKLAEEWLAGWASAEPYIGEIRAAIRKAES